MTCWPEGLVDLDSEVGRDIGFTCDKFSGWCWVDGDRFIISFIRSRRPGQGNLRRLIQAVRARGYRVAVPTPSTRMRSILRRLGFVPLREETDMGPCELLVSPVPQQPPDTGAVSAV